MPAPLPASDFNDSVTKHMRQDVSRLRQGQTIGEALTWLREHPPEGRIVYFYVVDDQDRLQGVVPVRRLVLSPLEKPLAEIMVQRVVALPAEATVLDACEFFLQHRFLAFPVVDEQRRLLGQVDVELYTDEMAHLGTEESRDDLFQLIGVHVAHAQQASPIAAFRVRFPWLLCNVVGGLAAAFLSGLYKDVLSWNHAVLALFIPIVLSLAESVGIQSVSLTVEILRGRQPSWSTLFPKIRIESLTGLLLGAGAGILVGAVTLLWLGHLRLAVCLLGGIAAGVTCAAVLGLTTPNLLRLLHRDPQMAAGPIALVAADLTTLLIYFNLARLLLV